MDRMWVRALALAILATLLAGPAFVLSKALAAALLLGAVGAYGWALVEGIKPRLRSRDPYDLTELRRVHEDEERRALVPDDVIAMPIRVVCSRCLSEYDARLRACPRCGAGG